MSHYVTVAPCDHRVNFGMLNCDYNPNPALNECDGFDTDNSTFECTEPPEAMCHPVNACQCEDSGMYPSGEVWEHQIYTLDGEEKYHQTKQGINCSLEPRFTFLGGCDNLKPLKVGRHEVTATWDLNNYKFQYVKEERNE